MVVGGFLAKMREILEAKANSQVGKSADVSVSIQ